MKAVIRSSWHPGARPGVPVGSPSLRTTVKMKGEHGLLLQVRQERPCD